MEYFEGRLKQTIAMSQTKQPTNTGALTTLIVVFFFWGFIAAGNSVFIPFCKNYFALDQFQSQLIDFAFYLAYYIGALGLFAYGALGGKDLVSKWGYKKSIVYGLLFSATASECPSGGSTLMFSICNPSRIQKYLKKTLFLRVNIIRTKIRLLNFRRQLHFKSLNKLIFMYRYIVIT